MKRITILDKQHKWMLKRFHTLCSGLKMDEETKRGIVHAYGKESSKDLTAKELTELCVKLEKDLNPEFAEMDVWRKRLIKVVGEWLKAMGKKNDIGTVKAVACRAAGVKGFNSIPQHRLCSLYNAFKTKLKDLKTVEEMTVDESDLLSLAN